VSASRVHYVTGDGTAQTICGRTLSDRPLFTTSWNLVTCSRCILKNPTLRRDLMIRVIYSTQAMEDPTMTMERAKAAYDAIQRERATGRKQ
jgi:hypothetical protein